MLLYGLKNCDTCRKALKALPEARFVDVRSDGVPDVVRARAYDTFGAGLVNTRSTTWRGLDADTRKQNPLTLLSAHPTLMKRPLIEVGGALFLGWNATVESQVKALL